MLLGFHRRGRIGERTVSERHHVRLEACLWLLSNSLHSLLISFFHSPLNMAETYERLFAPPDHFVVLVVETNRRTEHVVSALHVRNTPEILCHEEKGENMQTQIRGKRDPSLALMKSPI